MIYVTIGGHPQDFSRLIRKVDEIAPNFSEQFIIQKSVSKYTPRNAKFFDFVPFEEGENYIRNAKLVISHAGVGTIILARQYGVPIIIVPRLKEYNEHNTDHQLEIAKVVNEEKIEGIYVVYNVEDLEQTIVKILKDEKRKTIQISEGKNKIVNEIKEFIKSIEPKAR